MIRNFERSLSAVFAHEGGYVNHPKDPGGNQSGRYHRNGHTARYRWGRVGDTDIIDIKLLKPADAAKGYKAEYWDKVRGDDLPDGVDYATVDFAVNSGVSRAATCLAQGPGRSAGRGRYRLSW
jgi:lysozyme family protein